MSITKKHLRSLPPLPQDDEYYCIEKFFPPDETGAVFVSIRIINKTETFKMRIEEINRREWITKISAQDSFKIGALSNPAFSEKLIRELLAKSTNVIQNKFILLLSFLYLNLILLSNIIGSKLTSLGSFEFPAVLYFFPITFILGDVITEVYGYSVARFVIWLGFFSNFLIITGIMLVGMLPSAEHWNLQSEYNAIFNPSFQISLASCLAYLGSEFLNAALLSKFKKKINGRFLWARIMTASFVSGGIDSFIFCSVAFMKRLPNDLILKMIFAQFIFKFIYELFFSPVTCYLCKVLKKSEHIDKYDHDVNYSPFRL